MRIYTSSWFTALPADIQRIGISRGIPPHQPTGYKVMRELTPGPWFNSVSPQEYRQRYMAQLAALGAGEVVAKIERLAEGHEDAALLCYENDAVQWCHRSLVSLWLYDELEIEVPEFGMMGHGAQHPKLPPA